MLVEQVNQQEAKQENQLQIHQKQTQKLMLQHKQQQVFPTQTLQPPKQHRMS